MQIHDNCIGVTGSKPRKPYKRQKKVYQSIYVNFQFVTDAYIFPRSSQYSRVTAIIAVHARLLISIQNSIAKTLKLYERGLKLQEMKVNQVCKFDQENLLAPYWRSIPHNIERYQIHPNLIHPSTFSTMVLHSFKMAFLASLEALSVTMHHPIDLHSHFFNFHPAQCHSVTTG